MPKGKIVLKDNMGVHHVAGGCLACYGRYGNQTSEALSVLTGKLRKALPKEQHPSSTGWPATVAENISHVTIEVSSITSELSILSEGTEGHAKMSVVYAALANDSIWADAFLTKEWDDRDMEFDEIHMNPFIKAELMISAMSVLRRTCQHWYPLQYEYMVESGLNYESSLFFAILVTSGSIEDWGGDEQVLPLRNFSKRQLAAFLEGEFEVSEMDELSYAKRLGYRQTILEQWSDGAPTSKPVVALKNPAQSWIDVMTVNPFRNSVNTVTSEGQPHGYDPDVYRRILTKETNPPSRVFPETVFAKVLGVNGKTIKGELVKGAFGNHLYYDVRDAVDVSAGYKFLKEEVLAV